MVLTLFIDWLTLLVRWAHVVAGIAWIGSSFYFIALDASLKPNARLDRRVKGEAWQVHGGGFYQIQKYMVAPEFLPPDLTWFKWEAYSTWIFGFALLVLVYYLHPYEYLIDPEVRDLSALDAVPIAFASLAVGWFVYDALCRSRLGRDTMTLATCGFALLVFASWGYAQLFSGRGAFIQVGALVGTIMVANVLIVIIPNQRRVIADLLAGRDPPAHLGVEAKQRSLHNNYLTLPVVFTMLSNHASFTYATRYNWLVLAGVFVASALVRHWFNVGHTGISPDWRLWPAAAIPMLAAAIFAYAGRPQAPVALAGTVDASFAEVQRIVDARCHTCHAARPNYPGLAQAPKGVMFDTPEQIMALSSQIAVQAVATRVMPLNNVTRITEAERASLGAWAQTRTASR